ncbi:MAG TPA: hypothetical protein VGB52_01740 [Actinomycetota bacterium]
MIPEERFWFGFDDRFRWVLAALGVWPDRAWAQIAGGLVTARFGRWLLETPVENVAETSISGPYSPLKAIGVRWSFTDGGLTFGTNTERGICLRFGEAVPGGTPFVVITHPGLTLTLEEPELFGNAIARAQAGSASA